MSVRVASRGARTIVSALTEAIDKLRQIEEALQEHPRLARQVHDIAVSLGGAALRWVGLAEAQTLLEVYPEAVVADWARIGLLRSRYLPDGTLQVSLDDVLKQQSLYAALAAGWPDDLDVTEEHTKGGAIDLEAMSTAERAIVERARALAAAKSHQSPTCDSEST
jgi:hypothetical protein